MNYVPELRSWLLVFPVVLAASTAAAQTPNSDSEFLLRRVTALEEQVRSMETQPCSTVCDCRQTSAVCRECQSGGFHAGFAFVFAKPHFKESFQATYVDAGGTLNMVPFSYDYALTPRVWFGYTAANGLGIRTRYWQYDQSAPPFQMNPLIAAQANVVSVIFPATIAATPGEILDVADELEVQTVDLEGTQKIKFGKISIVGGGGLRYALMRQVSQATVTNQGVVTKSLNWLRKFEGIGPTISVEIERPLGIKGLVVIGAFRGSLLFGEKDLNRIAVNGIDEGLPVVALDNADEVLGIGELELGLEWTRQLAKGGSLFIRGTYEGQLWSDCGTPTLGYLGFQGFGLGFGFTR